MEGKPNLERKRARFSTRVSLFTIDLCIPDNKLHPCDEIGQFGMMTLGGGTSL